MMKTNLTPSPRLIGHGCCCCIKDFLYNKTTLVLMIFMLPLFGFAQQKQLQNKEKEAMQQEYLQSIYGNKTNEGLQQQESQEVHSLTNEESRKKQILNQQLRAKLENAGFNVQMHLDAGYTLEQILEEAEQLVTSNSKSNNNILFREDLCANATTLACDTPDTGSTVGANATDYVDCGGGPSNGEGVWYTFTGNQADNTISITQSSFAAQIHVYTGSCGAFNCAGGASGQGSTSVTLFAPGGDPIYVYVTGSFAGEGSFTIERTSTAPCNDTPPGDGYSAATALEIGCAYFDDTGDTTGFPNTETGPICSGNGTTGANGVWFKLNITADYPLGTGVIVDFSGTSFNAEASVYEGAGLDCVQFNDDGGTGNAPLLDFDAQPNTDYYIWFAGWASFDNQQGPYQIQVLCDGNEPPPPPQVPNNDTCPTSIELVCDGIPIFGNTDLATDIGNPGFVGGCGRAGSGDKTVWYTYSGDAGLITVSLCGDDTDFDTTLDVYTGQCNALTCLESNDDSCGLQSEIQFTADGSTVYYIAISGFSGSSGNYQLDVTCDLPPTVPDNDLCGAAEPINCDDVKTGNTLLATATGVEGLTDCDGQYSSFLGAGVWYVATGNGDRFTFDLCGSDYDTKVAVFTGSCGNFTCFTGNDDSFDCSDGTAFDSAVSFFSTPGETYYIYVTGFTGFTGDTDPAARGNYVLEMTCEPDPCLNATPIDCDSDIVFGNNSGENGFTLAPDFCGTAANESPGVMYEIIGDDRFISVNTCGSNFDTKLNVYSGACGALECVTGNDDWSDSTTECGVANRSSVLFFAAQGESYFIWVTGDNGATGDFALNIECLNAVENDLCEDAASLGCDTTVTGRTILSTDRGNPEEGCEGVTPRNGVWYEFLGTGGEVVMSTCSDDTDFDTTLFVYTGACDALECVTASDDSPNCSSSQSEVQFTSIQDEVYYIFVAGFGTQTGEFELTVDCLCAPSQEGPECVTLYDGYAPDETAVLTAELLYAEGAVTYAWSGGSEFDGDPSKRTVGLADGNSNITVTMTDEAGCTNSKTFFVYVVDVNCDTRGTDKVEVCHNGTTICVAPSAIAAHLAHGDDLGACGTQVCDEIEPFCDAVVTAPADGEIDVNITPTISWTAATGLVDGYYLTVGTTAGGTEILNAEDVGNVTSYTFDSELAYETTFYVSVAPYNENGTATNNCPEEISFTTIEDPLPNDDCDAALALTVNPVGSCASTLLVDHTTATDSGATFSCDSFPSNFDSWYTFVAVGSGVNIDITDFTQGGTPEYAVFDSCNGTEIFCGSGNSNTLDGLTDGVTYTLAIWYDDFNVEGTFEICLSELPPPPANDLPSGAITLTALEDNCTFGTFTNESATDSGVGSPTCAFYQGADVWFVVSVIAGNDYVFDTTQGVVTDSGMAIYSGSPGSLTLIECDDDDSANGAMSSIEYTPSVDQDIYVRVWEYGGNNNGTFGICVSFTPAPPPAACNDVTIEVGGGGFTSEVSWDILDANNVIVASGGAPEELVVNLPDGAYTINMFDSWGDGWNGNTYTLTYGTGGEITSGTLLSGSSGSNTFVVDCANPPPPPSCNDMFITVDGGSFDSEVSWEIYNSSNSLVLSGGAPDINIPVNLPDGNYTIEMSDSWGDGWNGNFYTIVDGNGSTIATGGLGSGSFGIDSFTVNCAGLRPGTDINNVSNTKVIDWTMSPNPTRGNVNLDLTNYLQSDVTIQVVDFTGKLISTRQLDNLKASRYTLELSNSLPTGMYFVHVSNANSTSAKKLVIMR